MMRLGSVVPQVCRIQVQRAPISGEIEVDRDTHRHVGTVALATVHRPDSACVYAVRRRRLVPSRPPR